MINIILLLVLDICYGYNPNPCKNTNLRNALLDLKIRTSGELSGMSDNDVRNTAISEIDYSSGESAASLQTYSNMVLVGKIYVMKVVHEEGLLSPGQMREYNAGANKNQLRDRLVVALNQRYGYSISDLHTFGDKELCCLWYSPMNCADDADFINDWDGEFSENIKDNQAFLSGIYSIHDNHREDRRFRFRRCTIGLNQHDNVTPVADHLQETYYDSTFTRSCGNINPNAAINRIVSTHDNSREDRNFKIYCSILPDNFKMRQCSWTDYLNGFDATIDFNCPNHGVIRSIQSYHDNHREDRRYKVECCRIGKEPLSFGDMRGRWKRVENIFGGSTTYVYATGVQESNYREITNEYSTTFEQSISIGLGFELDIGLSGGVEYSFAYSTTRTYSRTIGQDVTTYEERATEFECEKNSVYQWVIDGSEKTGDSPAIPITVYTKWLLCTTLPQPPKCIAPPGQYCVGENCEGCRYNQFDVISSQNIIAYEPRNSWGNFRARTLNYDNPIDTDTFQLEWNELADGTYKSKIVFKINNANINLFDDNYTNKNIRITVIASTSNLVPSNSNAYFCKACSPLSSYKPGDTCWGITPFSDNNRDCGCNSGGWTGQGIYYSGFIAKNANQCTGWGGGFTGQRYNGAKKAGERSIGFRLLAVTHLN